MVSRQSLDSFMLVSSCATRVAALEVGERLFVLREAGPAQMSAAELAWQVGTRLRLPTSFIQIRDVDQIPVTAAGKTDYARILREN